LLSLIHRIYFSSYSSFQSLLVQEEEAKQRKKSGHLIMTGWFTEDDCMMMETGRRKTMIIHVKDGYEVDGLGRKKCWNE